MLLVFFIFRAEMKEPAIDRHGGGGGSVPQCSSEMTLMSRVRATSNQLV